MKHAKNARRIKMSLGVARFIRDVAQKTFDDCKKKCDGGSRPCSHELRGTLQVARFVDSHLKMTAKRGYLDVPCPFLNFEDDEEAKRYIEVLIGLAARIREFSVRAKTVRKHLALLKVAEKIENYASRNPMEVLAESAI